MVLWVPEIKTVAKERSGTGRVGNSEEDAEGPFVFDSLGATHVETHRKEREEQEVHTTYKDKC